MESKAGFFSWLKDGEKLVMPSYHRVWELHGPQLPKLPYRAPTGNKGYTKALLRDNGG